MAVTQEEIKGQVEKVKIAGFVSRNASSSRIEEGEKELEKLKANHLEKEEKEEEEAIKITGEEKTFKKRYADLQRHAAKKEKDADEKITALTKQLELSTKKELKYPKTEEEMDTWIKEYPEIAAIVKTMAMKTVNEKAQEYEKKFKDIDEMKHDALRDKAEAELMKLHPDFDEIRSSDEFVLWAEEQPKMIQDALFENETDAKTAARAIDLYKTDMGNKITKRKKSLGDKEAAKNVSSRNSRTLPDTTGSTLKESEIDKMTMNEYAERQEEIAKAAREGKIIYDLSGNAR